MAATPEAGAIDRKPAERFLDAVERLGNRLPDPVAIFVIIIVVLMAVSAFGAAMSWSAINPVSGERLVAKSLLSEEMVRQLLSEMPRTFTGFAPLGLVLTIMLGAGVAEHSGLLAALIRKAVQGIPDRLLIPSVMLLGMLTVHAIDAGYLVYRLVIGRRTTAPDHYISIRAGERSRHSEPDTPVSACNQRCLARQIKKSPCHLRSVLKSGQRR